MFMDEGTDVLIIGSGLNSLASAMILQRHGLRVAIFEQAPEPGGAVKSGAYTEAGFTHDWGAMNLSLFAGSPFFQEFGAELAAAGLEFVPAPKCFASAFPDGRWLGIGNDATSNEAAIHAFASSDSKIWRDLSAQFPDQAAHIFAILGAPFGFRAVAKNIWNLLRQKKLSGALDLGQFLASSPRAWLDQTFTSAHVKSTLAAWGMHLDFAPDIAGGAVFPYLEAMANQAFGMVIGKGGADTVTRAMLSSIASRGGTVTCNAWVEHLMIEQGRAVGIRLADGSEHRAAKAVIANVAPKHLSAMIGETDPACDPAYDKGLRSFRHAPGTLMMHLAMEELPAWSASDELRDYAYVHLAPSLDQMARCYQQAQAGLLPDEPVVVVGQPTAIDPSRAPAGKHTLWLQVRMVPGKILGDAAGKINARDWQSAATPMAERALDIVEAYAPGTRSRIIAQKIVSPAELEADNPNLVGGDQICGSHHLSQHFMYRPMRGRSDGSTPIKALYHTGAAVWPGAGTGAGPGYLLGKKLTS
jgi:phytoene dehydrogenase-like protein